MSTEEKPKPRPTPASTSTPTSKSAGAVAAIILAAGKGTRMVSPLPKVLHPVAGTPMIHKVIRACLGSGAEEIRLVVGPQAALVKNVANLFPVHCFEQTQALGTADAVRAAQIDNLEGVVMIINGDHPLITASDLKALMAEFQMEKADIAVITAEVSNPGSLGRVVRHHGELMAIVEAKDASQETLKIKEVNSGLYLVKAEALQDLLPQIKNHNIQNEFYLTDLITLGREQGYKVKAIRGSSSVAFGVNTQGELAKATRVVFKRKAQELMSQGVVLIDPRNTYIEDEVSIGSGSVIYPGVYLKGKTKLGSFCVVEPHSFILDCVLEDSVEVKAGSYLEKSRLETKVRVGPYARLRPETVLEEGAQIGNFVELKKVRLGKGSKAGHLTYLGDAEIGADVNIGCGTITCNYAVDRKKYQTKIGDGVFVGSDVQFVAPVRVEAGAVIASGSTITEDVPAKALAIGRARQINKENYVDRWAAPDDENEG